MTLLPLPLFERKREAVIFFLLFVTIFCLNTAYRYSQYQNFLKTPKPSIEGTLLHHYQKYSKKGKPYHVLKIKTDAFTLYTTAWKKRLHVKKNDRVGLRILTKNIPFKDYLGASFFAPSFALHVKEVKPSLQAQVHHWITSQHSSVKMQELYAALFVASPIGKELRSDIQQWGVSHLIALSGFHLGFIFGVFYLVLMPIYRFLQNRYFPYRNAKIDVSVLVFGILLGYCWLIGFVPSFIRAWVMSVIGFWLVIRYMEVLSFTTLALTVCLLLAFFPSLIFSIGFFFSVLGVFYIFLYLHHFKDRFSPWQHAFIINLWVFLAMNIPVHFWFPSTSWQQFGAIPLSLVFGLFYPLSAFLHVIGLGDLLDTGLAMLLHVKMTNEVVFTPWWAMVLYLALSIVSIFQRQLAVGVICLGCLPFFFI